MDKDQKMNQEMLLEKISIREVIRKRHSSRTYKKQLLEEKDKMVLEEFMALLPAGPFGNKARFSVLALSEEDNDALNSLGTYGFVRNAPAFITCAMKDNRYALEDCGYLMEKAILHATELNLGTCWFGVYKRENGLTQRIELGDDEILPVVSPVGYAAEKPGKRDALIRWGIGAKKRKPWSELFFLGDETVLLTDQDAGDYSEALEMVRLAPSASNKQPWRIVKARDTNTFHFFLKRSKDYEMTTKVLKTTDFQRVDMGIAMCHFEATAREMGLAGQWFVEEPLNSTILNKVEYIASWQG